MAEAEKQSGGPVKREGIQTNVDAAPLRQDAGL